MPTYDNPIRMPRVIYRERDWHLTWQAQTDQIASAIAPVSDSVVALPAAEAPTSASLTVDVAAMAGFIRADNSIGAGAAAATGVAVPPAATTYLWRDAGTGAVATGTAWPATDCVPLAVVTTDATHVTSIADARMLLRAVGVGYAGVYLPISSDGKILHTGSTAGLKLGGATTEKLGFWNATPVAQPAGSGQAAPASLTFAAITDGSGGTPATAIPAATNLDTLTDGSGGTASTALAAIADPATADAVASLAAQVARQKTLNTLLINAVASLAAQLNHAGADATATRTLATSLRAALVAEGLIKGGA